MTDECDFDTTLKNMLATPPQIHQRLSDRSQADDGDDVVEDSEEEAGEE